ncbi:MAG: hypothetical protein NZV14_18345 [Bryobacteraceae bacterium]|nr:hypothetical protein [Bryobacteraceae bacterium]MDW8380127.1 hypothetical protein [Bryobacterales bacterium]
MNEEEYLNQARFWAGQNQYGKAIELLEEAVASGNETSEICKELARLSLTVNEVRAFANWCHEAIRINRTDPEPYLMIGRVLVAEGRWSEAIEALQQALTSAYLAPDQQSEAAGLLRAAEQGFAQYKSTHPGTSNL